MPDEGIAALPNERPRERRAVPNVKLHILQRRRALMNEKKIRPIKTHARPALIRYPTAGEDRVLNRESFKSDAANLGSLPFLNQMSILDVAVF
jgi:hypothetical protein